MSIDTLTGDDFMQLDAADHRIALEQYDSAIDAALSVTTAGLPAATRHHHLDRLSSLLTLRKVHKQRLEELEEEDNAPASLTALERYEQNERLAPAA